MGGGGGGGDSPGADRGGGVGGVGPCLGGAEKPVTVGNCFKIQPRGGRAGVFSGDA